MKKKFPLFVCLLLLFLSLFGEGVVVAEETYPTLVVSSRNRPTLVIPVNLTLDEITPEVSYAAIREAMALDVPKQVSEEWVVCCEPNAPRFTFITQKHYGGNPCSYYQQTCTGCEWCGYVHERGPLVFVGTHYPCPYFP